MDIFQEICALIVFFNGNENVIHLVEEFSTFMDLICVVNNGSTEGLSVIKRLKQSEKVVVIDNEQNMGIAYALNQGLKFARENKKNYLLTMDQDSFIDRNSVISMLQLIKSEQNVISVGPYYGTNRPENYKENTQVNFLITSGNLIDVDETIAIGGFNSDLFIDCVDIDYSFNILLHDKRMMKCGGAYMRHKIGEYERSKVLGIQYKGHSDIRYYYKYRNNIYIYKRYGKRLPVHCMKLFCSLARNGLQVLLIENNKKNKLKQIQRGITDGIRI